MEDTTM